MIPPSSYRSLPKKKNIFSLIQLFFFLFLDACFVNLPSPVANLSLWCIFLPLSDYYLLFLLNPTHSRSSSFSGSIFFSYASTSRLPIFHSLKWSLPFKGVPSFHVFHITPSFSSPSLSFQSPVSYPNLPLPMVFSPFLIPHLYFLLHSFHSNHRLSQFLFSNGVHFLSHAYSISFLSFSSPEHCLTPFLIWSTWNPMQNK